ncbi:MAG: MATE family efflux transporter [Acidobacteriota bacterium]|nr:MATE family efflux transporter [Acidobacteriota bacterium]
MLDRQRTGPILTLGLPIIGGMISQNVLNLVDTAMVGTLGPAALAAVGMGSFANFMAMAFIMGLSAGVQAISARRLGEGRLSETASPLNAGLLIALVVAVPWSFFLFGFADRLYPMLVDDPEVVALGVPYFRARLIGMTAIGMNYAFRGFWNGISESRRYLQTLLIMHVCNVVLNWLLIFGHLGLPALGAEGAGIGTTIATYIGTAIYFILALRHARPLGFLRSFVDRATISSMVKLSVPAGLQSFFFAAGMTAFFWIIGRIGTPELAASNVLVQLLLVAILPGLGFGLAAASLVGQALGRGDRDDAVRWGWDVSKFAMVLVGGGALVGLVFPDALLRLFLHDEHTIALARFPLRLLGATMTIETLGGVLMNALLGAGASRLVMKVSIGMQWGLFLPAAYLLGPVLGLGLSAVWSAQVAYRVLQALVFAMVWRSQAWIDLEV